MPSDAEPPPDPPESTSASDADDGSPPPGDLTPFLEPDVDADDAPETGDAPELPAEVAAIVQRVVRRALAWRAPLPPPDMLQEYEDVDTGLMRKIVDHFERHSSIEVESLRHQFQTDDRELGLLEREQRLRIDESEDDRRARRFVLGFGAAFLTLLVILAFVALMWGPLDSDWGRVGAAGVFLAAISLLGAVVLLRGRMTEHERDVYRAALPHIGGRQAEPPQLKPGEAKDAEP